MKKILSVIFSSLLICSAAACSPVSEPAASSDAAAGESMLSTESISSEETAADDNAPSDSEEPSVNEEESLPSKVDLRDYNGKNYVTPVKRQAFGDCWSFGNIAAAESSYLYVNELGVPAGENNFNVNFSERYLSWYVYHSITEEDVKVGKVRASQVGEGYDVSQAESKHQNAVFNLGVAGLSGTAFFASGFGPVDESTEVNGVYPYAYSDKNERNEIDEYYENYSQSGDWSIPLNALYRNPPISALLRNGSFLPSPASKDANGNYVYNEDGVNAIRSEIAKGHAVSVAALVFGRMNYDNWATYTTADEQNHVITIVGYDDDYPKENFAKTNDVGETDPDSIPPTDGAFIIKDSNGENGGYDGMGSFYISYHDHTLAFPISFEFDRADSVKYTTLNYDQYDLLMIGWCASADYDSETKMANVFDAEEDEYLYQLTYRTKAPDTSVHYEVYKAPQDGNPDSGELLEEGDSVHRFGGSHKIDLRQTYRLSKGEKYSVVLTMTRKTDDGASVYTDVIPYATDLPGEITAKAVVNKGESFLYSGGKWLDMTEMTDELKKTAYEQNLREAMPANYYAKSADNVVIDNFPIKALLIPAGEYAE